MTLCGDDHPKLISRINRIEGQVKGLKKINREIGGQEIGGHHTQLNTN